MPLLIEFDVRLFGETLLKPIYYLYLRVLENAYLAKLYDKMTQGLPQLSDFTKKSGIQSLLSRWSNVLRSFIV